MSTEETYLAEIRRLREISLEHEKKMEITTARLKMIENINEDMFRESDFPISLQDYYSNIKQAVSETIKDISK